jgi:hypothetical protein
MKCNRASTIQNTLNRKTVQCLRLNGNAIVPTTPQGAWVGRGFVVRLSVRLQTERRSYMQDTSSLLIHDARRLDQEEVLAVPLSRRRRRVPRPSSEAIVSNNDVNNSAK